MHDSTASIEQQAVDDGSPQLDVVLAAVVGGDLLGALVLGTAAGLAGLAGDGTPFLGTAGTRPVERSAIVRELGLPRKAIAQAVAELADAGALRVVDDRPGRTQRVEVAPGAVAARWRIGTRLRLPRALRCGVRLAVLGVVGYVVGQAANGRCSATRSRMSAVLGLSVDEVKRAVADAEGRFLRSWHRDRTAYRKWEPNTAWSPSRTPPRAPGDLRRSAPPPAPQRTATCAVAHHAIPEESGGPGVVPEHPPLRRQLAIVRVPDPAPDPDRDQVADDPVPVVAAEQQQQQPTTAWAMPTPSPIAVPPWLATEGAERAAAASMRSWDAFDEGLRHAVGRLHAAVSTPHNLHSALIAVGLLVMPRNLSHAGRLGLRTHREEVAERLAQQRVQPSQILEAAHLAVAIVRRRPNSAPRHVGAFLRQVLAVKGRDYLQRSRDLVAAGKAALPMAAGADALDRLVGPQNRGIGWFAYPSKWWQQGVHGAVLRERSSDVRAVVAGLAARQQVRDLAGEVAAERLRQQLDAAERERQARRTLDDATRRQRGRIVGAVLAQDWHRLAGWLVGGITAAQVAEWSGTPEATIRAGIAATAAARTRATA